MGSDKFTVPVEISPEVMLSSPPQYRYFAYSFAKSKDAFEFCKDAGKYIESLSKEMQKPYERRDREKIASLNKIIEGMAGLHSGQKVAITSFSKDLTMGMVYDQKRLDEASKKANEKARQEKPKLMPL